MLCPGCGAQVADDAFVCDACDYILDTSFLEDEADAPALDDEHTDPGLVGAPPIDDEGTDPGTAAGPVFGDDGSDPGRGVPGEAARRRDDATGIAPTPGAPPDASDERTAIGPAPTRAAPYGRGPSAPEAPPRRRGPAMPEAPPPMAHAPEPPPGRPLPPPPPPRPSGFAPASPRPVPPPSPRGSAPTTGSGVRTAGGSLRERLDLDTSSQLMDDYDKMFRDLGERLKALPTPEKVNLGALTLALVSVLMPWAVEVSPAGTADEHLGMLWMGWLSLILAAVGLALFYYRHTRSTAPSRGFALGQVGVAGVGLLWGMVSLAAAAHMPTPLVNPHQIDPGAAYGLYLNLLAWVAAGLMGLAAVRDAPPG